jgi:caffeoyl-CoA O-methyltransferase
MFNALARSLSVTIVLALGACSTQGSAIGRSEDTAPPPAAERANAAAPANAPNPTAVAPSIASTLTADVRAVLDRIKRADTGQLAVSEEDGRFLRLLTAASRSKRALEIGAASGYSAIWIGLGMRETGGRLVTIEYDPQRAREAAENVKAAGLSDIVTVVTGDAFKEIPKLQGTFDLVFCDAWKKDYIRFFELVLPRLERGGLFLGHNVVNKRSEMGDFLDRIEKDPALVTSIVMPSGEGVSITLKR